MAVSPDVARALYPHTLAQARRSVLLQGIVLTALAAAALVGGLALQMWGLALFVIVGAVATGREAAWFLQLRRADPVSAYHAAQQRRDHNFSWLAWFAYGPCVVALAVVVVRFVIELAGG